jgi:seryl-tRNA synthetase
MSNVLPLPKPVGPELASDIEKAAAYVASTVTGLRVSEDGLSVSWDTPAGVDDARSQSVVARLVKDMVASHRPLPRRVIAERPPAPGRTLHAGIEAGLRSRGWVRDMGPGQVALSGPALAVMHAIDAETADVAHSMFDAPEERYPSLISVDTLARCGYLSNFAHSLNFVTHLAEDYEGIERFRQENLRAERPNVPVCSMVEPRMCLKPAICYHCYPALEGQVIASPGRSLTCVGRVFRYEAGNVTGIERLWEFGCRDIVWIGTFEWVVEQRRRIVEWTLGMLERWDLDGVIETANDPFFPTAHAAKTYWQVLGELKYELRLPLEPGPDGKARTLAASSFNLHQDFMTTAFNIRMDDKNLAHTGCVGWGLERWVLAIFTRHGLDIESWPASVRARLGAP